MKKFKSKKRFSNLLLYFVLFLVSVSLSIRYLYKYNKINDDTLVDLLVNDTMNYYNSDITSIDFLLKYALNVDLKKEEKVFLDTDIKKEEEVEVIKEEVKKPLVYIYNTHSEEKYSSSYVKDYNVTPSVMLASKILKEYLENLGIGVVVEEENVVDKLNALGWSYGSSYKVSRMFMEDAYSKNPSLKYFIDIHRDSSSYNATTCNIDGKKYAKLLFVVGLDNPNYEPNLKLSENLVERINKYNDNLNRGIMKKSGNKVNGVYNQDFNHNTFLIEVGGQYNSINEVNNTLNVFANILSEYIKENENG